MGKDFKIKLPEPFEEEKKIIDSLQNKPTIYQSNSKLCEQDSCQDAAVETWYIRKQVMGIDTREFWSQIPHYIYQAGFWVIPIQLQIGDYILSDDIAVERKSVSSGDFQNSLGSGRLLTQTSKMTKFFKKPILLIEFDESIPFVLKERECKSLAEDDISPASIFSKLFVLVSNFPSLFVIWSKTPLNTVQIFKSLKETGENPDLDKISKIGRISGNKENENDDGGVDLMRNDSQEEDEYSESNSSYIFLSSLPGVFSDNIDIIMNSIDSMQDLCEKSEIELEKLIGTANSIKLYSFLHTNSNKNLNN